MAYAWHQTKHEGVRYREHPTRKHGVKLDQYFAIRYRVNGKRREEGLGWATQGWTLQRAALELAKLKEAHRTGEGARTLEEKRHLAEAKLQAEAEAKAKEERDNLTFGEVFELHYLPHAEANKGASSIRAEKPLFRLWIKPVIGDKPLKDIAPIPHLEKIKKAMAEAERPRSPRTIAYALAVIRQVFNYARVHGLFAGANPVSNVKKPSEDNRRLRFLSHEEADQLLEALASRSLDIHDMALLSLHCGLRAGEIFRLKWGDVDLVRGIITIKGTHRRAGTRTKSGKTRPAMMTEALKAMFKARENKGPDALIFPPARRPNATETDTKRSKGTGRITQISETFDRTVLALGLNTGVTDPRQKVVFHTLRHTFASWLAEQDVNIYTIKDLMGHGTLAMTERYAHLSPQKLRSAVNILEDGIAKAQAKGRKVVPINE
jgi:integrase